MAVGGGAAEGTGLPSPVEVAGLASLGAGVIHASAIGLHAEHPSLSRLFVVLAAAQILVGLLLLARGGRLASAAGAVVNAGAVGGWVLTRTSGVSWIDGLEQSEPAQFADTVCATLGALAVLGAVVAVGRRRTGPGALSLNGPVVLVAGLTVAAMVMGTTHEHTHDPDSVEELALGAHGHGGNGGVGHEATAETPSTVETLTGAVAVAAETSVVAAHDDHHDTGAAAEAKPFDPTQPIDLSGVDGVTPEQQAAAENLVSRTVVELPQWADPDVAEAAGFHSIGDAGSGHEHFVNWAWLNDDVWLDPDFPESLVYEPHADGSRSLVSAMFMLPESMTLADVPDIGGRLMQWHVHDNLCFTDDPVAPQFRGTRSADGTCSPPGVAGTLAPMIHVWIVPNECGPFAALEGLGAGSIADGEERWCDAAHGSHGL